MKKLLAVFLAFLILFSFVSCEDKAEAPDMKNLDLEGFKGDIPIYVVTDLDFAPTDTEVADWENYMKDKYNVSIDLNYLIMTEGIDELQNNDNQILYSDFINTTDKQGFLISDENFFGRFIEENCVTPVNDFMDEVTIVNLISDKMLSKYTDSSGNVWGIPSGNIVRVPTRLYCDEWLKAAGMKVPESLNDYWNFAEYLASNDPDGNGKNDTFIQNIQMDVSIFYSFGDVFLAHGCYPGRYSPIGYNPRSGKFEDIIFDENFKNAIGFIKQMKDDGLFFEGGAPRWGGYESEFLTGSLRTDSHYPNYWEGWQESFYLLGDNSSELVYPIGDESGLMVLEGTEEAAKMLNIICSISDTRQGMLDLTFGVEGYNYEMGENYINLITRDENDNRRNNIMVYFGVFDEYKKMLEEGYMFIADGYMEMLDYKSFLNEDNDFDNVIGNMMDSDLFYVVPGLIDYRPIRDIDSLIAKEIYILFLRIFEEEMDMDEAIEMYRAKTEPLGITQMLEEINAELAN